MTYPKRSQSHVQESASFKAFEACIPDMWMLRHVTERDYGIDCIVELVGGSGEVCGDLAAIQLKSSRIAWRASGVDGRTTGSIGGVKTSTLNYWLSLPIPVFLCVHESDTPRIHVVDVRQQVRSRYRDYCNGSTVSFRLDQRFDLATPDGLGIFVFAYMRQREFDVFASALLDLLSNRTMYVDFLEGSVGCDCFLEVDQEELAQLIRLYNNCKTVLRYAGQDWKVTHLSRVLDEDRKTWGKKYILLHEASRDSLAKELVPAFIAAVDEGLRLVYDKEAAYWSAREPFLFGYAESFEVKCEVELLKSQLAWLL